MMCYYVILRVCRPDTRFKPTRCFDTAVSRVAFIGAVSVQHCSTLSSCTAHDASAPHRHWGDWKQGSIKQALIPQHPAHGSTLFLYRCYSPPYPQKVVRPYSRTDSQARDGSIPSSCAHGCLKSLCDTDLHEHALCVVTQAAFPAAALLPLPSVAHQGLPA